MKTKSRWIAICAMTIASLCAEENKTLPNVTLDQVKFGEVVNGVTLSTEALKGKVVVVERWGTKCGPCVAFLPELAKIHSRYDNKGLQVVGIEVEGSEKDAIAKLCKSARVKYPVVKGGRVPVPIKLIPHACVFGSDGKLVWAGNPNDGEFLSSIRIALKDVADQGGTATTGETKSEASGPLVAVREWKNREGKGIRAELVRVNGDKVVFRMDGREISYEVAKLCESDQAHIKNATESQGDNK